MFPDRFLNLSFSKAHRQLTYLSHPIYNSLRKMNAQANANVNNNQAHQQGGQGQQQPAPQAGQYGFIGPLPQGQLPPYLPPNAAVPLQGPPPVPGAIPPILQQVADTLEGVTQHLLLLQPPPIFLRYMLLKLLVLPLLLHLLVHHLQGGGGTLTLTLRIRMLDTQGVWTA